MKTLFLKPGFEALVSDEDHAWASQFKWTLTRCGSTSSGAQPKYYAKRNVKGKSTYLHREVILQQGIVIPDGHHVDHAPDNNGLNCQRGNLTVVTPKQNLYRTQFKLRTPAEPTL